MKTEERKDWITLVTQMMAEGHRMNTIANRLGVSAPAFYAWRKRWFRYNTDKRDLQICRARSLEPKLRELAGLSYGAEDIGPKCNISPATARTYLKLLKIPFSTNNRKVFRYDTSTWDRDVLKWHRAGISRAEIAKRKKCSVCTVFRFLANNGHITVREWNRRK